MPDAAIRAARSVVDDAVAVGHALSLCLALVQAACPVAPLVGDIKQVRRSVDILLNTATTHAIDVWHSGWYEGAVLVRNGNFHDGQRVLLNAMDGPPYIEGNVHRLEMLIELSHAFACVGDFQQSSDILDDALADSTRRQERWCLAELLRMKGEVLLSVDAPDSETRMTSSLARLRRRQGRPREGRACLEPVYRRFTEGFDTGDLIAAWELLNELGV